MLVKCDNCNKELFDTEHERKTLIGIEAQRKGFVYKNACLFSDTYTSLFFCTKDCAKMFYEKNIPKTPENIKRQKALEEVRKEIPQMAKDVCDKMDRLVKEIDNFNRRKNGNNNKTSRI